MTRRTSQFRVGNPDVLLLLALLARPHRHARILRTKLVSTSTISAQESRLAPQPAREEINTWMPLIYDAVMRRIDGGQSRGFTDAVTANEILYELQPPPDLRKELVLWVRYVFAALEREGHVTQSTPRCPPTADEP